MPFGKIEPFDLFSGNWTTYVRRIEQFMFLNDIKETHRVATLVTLVGYRTYNLMCDLCGPDRPEDKTFEQLVQIVKSHVDPQCSVYAEREIFRQRRQKPEESIGDLLQTLKHLASSCNFAQNLEESLCEQFVTGLKSTEIKSRLLFDAKLTYKRAVELALNLEATEKHVERVSGRVSMSGAARSGDLGDGAPALAAISAAASSGSQAAGESLHALRGGPAAAARSAAAQPSCWRCGKSHRADKCRFKQYTTHLSPN